MGDALALKREKPDMPVLKLTPAEPDSSPIEIAASKGNSLEPGSTPTRWHAYFVLPPSIAVGMYSIAIRNSASSAFTPICTFIDPLTPCLSALNVSSPVQWDNRVFTVNATQPGVGRDATKAVSTALAKANANGGGVVFFPRGQYFIKGPLIVDPGAEYCPVPLLQSKY